MNFEEQVSPSLMRAQTTPSERIGVECVCASCAPSSPHTSDLARSLGPPAARVAA